MGTLAATNPKFNCHVPTEQKTCEFRLDFFGGSACKVETDLFPTRTGCDWQVIVGAPPRQKSGLLKKFTSGAVKMSSFEGIQAFDRRGGRAARKLQKSSKWSLAKRDPDKK